MQLKISSKKAWLTISKTILEVLLVASTLAVGCNRKPESSRLVAQENVKIYTETEINKLIVPGISEADVTKQFGSPGSISEIGQGAVMWTYSFPLQPEKAGLHLAGFSIYLRDGKVEKWSPIMEEARQTFQAGGTQGSFGEQTFQVFLATEAQTNVVNAVDSRGSADASDLEVAPDLEFKAKVFAGSGSNERPGEQTVILVISEQDASKLKDLSENNFGRRLLIVTRRQVIAAPAISAPLASRQFIFTVKNSAVNNAFRSQ
jgi:hypothetical protein